MANHQQALTNTQRDLSGRRQYVQNNVSSILSDSFAAFETLRAWAQLSALRRARAQARGEHPYAELPQIRREIEADLNSQRILLGGLIRELRIISELPGEWTLPYFQKRQDQTASRDTATKLLEELNPLAQQLGIQDNPLPAPAVTCAPTDYDINPYTKILRWYLEEGEELRALAFPLNALTHRFFSPQLDKVNSSINLAWSNLPKPEDTTGWSPGRAKRAALRKGVSPEMVAVSDRRIITADPQEFIQKGIVKEEFSIDDVTPTFTDTDTFTEADAEDVLPELHITQGEKKCREWRFPSRARSEARSIAEMLVDDPAQLQPPMKPELTDSQKDEIETSEKDDPKSEQSHQPAPNGASAQPETEETPADPTAWNAPRRRA